MQLVGTHEDYSQPDWPWAGAAQGQGGPGPGRPRAKAWPARPRYNILHKKAAGKMTNLEQNLSE